MKRGKYNKTPNQVKTDRIVIRVTHFEKEHLQSLASQQDKQISKIIMDALMQYDSGFNQKKPNLKQLTNEKNSLISLIKIIELTQCHTGQHKQIWLNANEISSMEIVYKPDETFTRIFAKSDGSTFGVMETPEEIIELIKNA